MSAPHPVVGLTPAGGRYSRVRAVPSSGVLLWAFWRATILTTYSVAGFRPEGKTTSETKRPRWRCHSLPYQRWWRRFGRRGGGVSTRAALCPPPRR